MSFFTTFQNFRDKIVDAVTRDPDSPAESISEFSEFGDSGNLDPTGTVRGAAGDIVQNLQQRSADLVERRLQGSADIPVAAPDIRFTDGGEFDQFQDQQEAIREAIGVDAQRLEFLANPPDTANVSIGPEDEAGATASAEETEDQSNDQDFSSSGLNVPLRNPLSGFASYAPVISLYVLTKDELRDPDSYRKNPPQFLIARTGGLGNDTDEVAPTIFEENLGKRVEYFIDDLEIDSLLSHTAKTRQTNATTIKFRLSEPYSMGMFLKSLQFTVGRSNNQRISYIDPPYLLQIEFKGFDDQGNFVKVPGTTRYIPFKLINIQFNVSAGGSEYEIDGIAWNDQALSDEIQVINENLSINGSTVKEFLTNGSGNKRDDERQGLEAFLNKRENDFVNPGGDKEPFKEKPDRYVISFPTSDDNRANQLPEIDSDRTATIFQQNVDNAIRVNQGLGIDEIAQNKQALQNQIGRSKIVVDSESAGTVSDDSEFIQLRRVGVRRDGRVLQFPSGMRIQDIIEEVVLLSEYAKDLAELNTKKSDNLGYRNWFRIETQVFEESTEPDKITGKTPKLYVYSVVPYKVESHRFLRPTESLGKSSIDLLKQLAPKKYNYIYSGQNDDIINFDLQFNTAFFQGLQEDLGQNSQRNQEGARAAGSAEEESDPASLRAVTTPVEDLLNPDLIENSAAFSDVSDEEQTGLPRLLVQAERIAGSNTGRRGGSAGSGDTDERTAIARNFNEIIVNGLDLITLDLEIWGDPFYIADSGIGNYNAAGTDNPFVTENNTLDYQYFEPICRLEFKTPLDYNKDGGMDFPESQGEVVGEFSGVYRIMTVQHRISSNRFTQQLQMVRLRNQELAEPSTEIGPGTTVRAQRPLSGQGQTN